MKNWTQDDVIKLMKCGYPAHYFIAQELNALELRAWNAEELVRQAIAQGFKVGKTLDKQIRGDSKNLVQAQEPRVEGSTPSLSTNLSSSPEGRAGIPTVSLENGQSAQSLSNETASDSENQASPAQFNLRDERELDSVRAGRDRSAGTAQEPCGHEGSIPSVSTLSPAPTITDEKREDDSGTVCPPRMSQEGSSTDMPEKADLPGETFNQTETNHLHLLAEGAD